MVAGQTGRLEVGLAMSALGQKQTFNDGCPMSALPPEADIALSTHDRLLQQGPEVIVSPRR
jgi:hypothetical protein